MYRGIINQFLILLPLALSPFIDARQTVCQEGEVGLGVVDFCPFGKFESCSGNYLAGVIVANNCNWIDISSSEGLCEGGWTPLKASVDCKDDSPNSVHTPGATFGNCYQVSQFSDNQDCGPSSITRPFALNLFQCCKRLTIQNKS